MRKIVLASQSPQRKKLLKLLGLSFTVRPADVKEDDAVKTTCSGLVKQNALQKARAAAVGFKDAVIIAADTLIYLGKKKIVGKPKNLKEAKRTLKMICRQPQWVYTGLAVVDSRSGKTVVDYEKTKIIMQRLSDQQIDRYYRHVFALDKAGGFDIEGRGGLLIRRIEGCYFNVIGLPLARLCGMLKKVGVSTFLTMIIFVLGGCVSEYNLATQKEETLIYGTEKEIQIGDSLARQFEKEFEVDTDVDINERVKRIGQRLFDVCDRKDLVYTIKVIKDDKVNAVSLPGGYIYVNRGLVDNVDNDDQLACVIGHEAGHITAKHSIKKIQNMYGYAFLKILSIQAADSNISQGVDVAFVSLLTQYSQADEFLADRLGIKYAKKAGYDSAQMAVFLKKLAKIQQKEPPKQFSYWRTHPYVPQRIAAVNQVISGKLEFKDYLNLTGEER